MTVLAQASARLTLFTYAGPGLSTEIDSCPQVRVFSSVVSALVLLFIARALVLPVWVSSMDWTLPPTMCRHNVDHIRPVHDRNKVHGKDQASTSCSFDLANARTGCIRFDSLPPHWTTPKQLASIVQMGLILQRSQRVARERT
jgi:hypothetical protein